MSLWRDLSNSVIATTDGIWNVTVDQATSLGRQIATAVQYESPTPPPEDPTEHNVPPPPRPPPAIRRITHNRPIGFSFSPAGLLLPYHLGVGKYLVDSGIITEHTPLAGASAGSITVATLVQNLSAFDTLQCIYRLESNLRAKGTARRLKKLLHRELNAVLPPNAHEIANSRPGEGYVVYTTVMPWRAQSPYTFESRDDYISCILASCNIPFYFARSPTIACRGYQAVDGYFADRKNFGCPNVPNCGRVIRILPFSRKQVLSHCKTCDVISPDLSLMDKYITTKEIHEFQAYLRLNPAPPTAFVPFGDSGEPPVVPPQPQPSVDHKLPPFPVGPTEEPPAAPPPVPPPVEQQVPDDQAARILFKKEFEPFNKEDTVLGDRQDKEEGRSAPADYQAEYRRGSVFLTHKPAAVVPPAETKPRTVPSTPERPGRYIEEEEDALLNFTATPPNEAFARRLPSVGKEDPANAIDRERVADLQRGLDELGKSVEHQVIAQEAVRRIRSSEEFMQNPLPPAEVRTTAASQEVLPSSKYFSRLADVCSVQRVPPERSAEIPVDESEAKETLEQRRRSWRRRLSGSCFEARTGVDSGAAALGGRRRSGSMEQVGGRRSSRAFFKRASRKGSEQQEQPTMTNVDSGSGATQSQSEGEDDQLSASDSDARKGRFFGGWLGALLANSMSGGGPVQNEEPSRKSSGGGDCRVGLSSTRALTNDVSGVSRRRSRSSVDSHRGHHRGIPTTTFSWRLLFHYALNPTEDDSTIRELYDLGRADAFRWVCMERRRQRKSHERGKEMRDSCGEEFSADERLKGRDFE